MDYSGRGEGRRIKERKKRDEQKDPTKGVMGTSEDFKRAIR
jgi:hypothetical protein